MASESLASDFRAKAKATLDVINPLIAKGFSVVQVEPGVFDEATKQITGGKYMLNAPELLISAIVGSVNVHLFMALADLTDHFETLLIANGNRSAVVTQRAAIIEKGAALRLASAKGVATGNWDDLDAIVNGPKPDVKPTDGAAAAAQPG